MNKLKVAIIYGGCSGEHEVSCISAAAVLQNLDRDLFDPVLIGIDKDSRWLMDKEENIWSDNQTSLKINYETSIELPLLHGFSPKFLKNLNNKLFDIAFPVVHGIFCEDGTLQGLFELTNVPYVGANVLSSAIGMDKEISKLLVKNINIPVAPFIVVHASEWQHDIASTAKVCKKIMENFNYPLFVKPCNTGSSVGITKAHDENELIVAINNAFEYDLKIIIEKALNVRDVELSVLENIEYGSEPHVSTVGEIVLAPKHEFYSYTAKYLDPDALILDIPAKISSAQLSKLQTMAKQIFRVLQCESMARVDLFIEKDTDQIYFNEINTLPGFTQYSMYPRLWEKSGINYKTLLTQLLQLAVARFERKQKLKRDWQ